MICRRCGATNDEEATACRVCGLPPGDEPLNLQKRQDDRAAVPDVLHAPPEPEPAGGQPPPVPISSLALASLVAGILAWFAFPVVGAVVAIVCGHFGLNEIRQGNGELHGRGLAIAGLVLGYIQAAIVVLMLVGIIVFAAVTFLLFQVAGTAR